MDMLTVVALIVVVIVGLAAGVYVMMPEKK